MFNPITVGPGSRQEKMGRKQEIFRCEPKLTSKKLTPEYGTGRGSGASARTHARCGRRTRQVRAARTGHVTCALHASYDRARPPLSPPPRPPTKKNVTSTLLSLDTSLKVIPCHSYFRVPLAPSEDYYLEKPQEKSCCCCCYLQEL